MTTLYLIEDDPYKEDQVLRFLGSAFPAVEVRPFHSYQTGLRALKEAAPDVLILDMTLPTFDRDGINNEGRMRPIAGYEIMRKIKLFEISTQVILLTHFTEFNEGGEIIHLADIKRRCKAEFLAFFVDAVYFDQTENNWKERLKALLETLLKAPT
jgi:CheY-like chemotaxis protein